MINLDELKKMKPTIFNIGNGRPDVNLTDKQWQEEFIIRKMYITPLSNKITKLKGQYSQESYIWDSERQGTYLGATNWQQYCSYINSVLKTIRCGEHDYCYYIYQILDLLKFHYNTLHTKYLDGYWEVWLEDERKVVNE